ncbi:LysR family transcriptional regulator [Actinomadura sp. WMMA1423]|uniref:LysR family transcriptional regulator n=1 Tax=Actinomadura sp. WMMA1423 TaxID=2591108 RepID=UPI001147938E|nr:LysR family transcriptional regulator [Actinomadura sp. WMMA1423]
MSSIRPMVSLGGAVGLASIDLNLLVALDALLSECNVTRAAERTSVGQPAMSASLARLRRHFDDQLLIRQGRNLVRTPLAETLVDPVREALSAAEAVFVRSPDFDPRKDHAAFTIMAADYVTMVLLRPLLAAIAEEAPHVRIGVRSFEPDFADRLRRGHADMVIIPTELSRGRVAFPYEPLFTDRYVLIVDRDNPDVGETVTVEQLASLRFVAYSAGILSIVDSELEALGLRLQVDVTAQEFVVASFLVGGTRLASFALERLAKQLADVARLRIVDCPLPLRSIHETLYWNPRRTEDPAHRWLRGRIVQLARSL